MTAGGQPEAPVALLPDTGAVPSLDLTALTRAQRRALFAADRPRKAGVRLMPTEADALAPLLAGDRTGVWVRSSPSGPQGRTYTALVRLFDRGLLDVVAVREDGYLRLGFTDASAEAEAHRLLWAPHLHVPLLAWCRRGLVQGTTPLTAPMAVSMLVWHYADPADGSSPAVEVTITRRRTPGGGPAGSPAGSPGGTPGEPAPYRFTTRHRDGSTRTQQVPAPFADDLPAEDTTSAGAVELDRRIRSLVAQTPDRVYAYRDDEGTYDQDALSVLGWVCRTATPFPRFDPGLDGNPAPAAVADPASTVDPIDPTRRTGGAGRGCGDVVVDLTRFTLTRIRPRRAGRSTGGTTGAPAAVGTAQARFADTAPVIVRDALTTLGAPPVSTAAEFVAWAERHCTLTVSCGGAIPEPEQEAARYTGKIAGRGAKRHTLHVDPHTGQPLRITTGGKHPATDPVDAEHLLWALSMGTANGCDRARRLLHTLGEVDRLARYTRFSARVVERAHAVRTIACAVGYLDAGLDLTATSDFLALGLPGPQTARVMAAVNSGATSIEEALAVIGEVLDLALGSLPAGEEEMAAITGRIVDPTHDAATDPIGRRASALHEALRNL